jgi:[ribosomal protein S5]-alanine N-acetyltransferase
MAAVSRGPASRSRGRQPSLEQLVLIVGLERGKVPVYAVDQRDGRHARSNSIAAMQVRGPAVTLRYATPADAPALMALGSDPAVTRFFSWGPYTEIEQPRVYIDGLAGDRDRGERLDFLIVDAGGRALGVTGLTEFNRRDRRAVVGTWLGRDHWGTGVNREAKALIARLAFDALGLERLGAYANLDNPRSQTALSRLGFTREGVLRRWHRHGEHVHDVLVYSWLREEWRHSPLFDVDAVLDGEPPSGFSCAAAPS